MQINEKHYSQFQTQEKEARQHMLKKSKELQQARREAQKSGRSVGFGGGFGSGSSSSYSSRDSSIIDSTPMEPPKSTYTSAPRYVMSLVRHNEGFRGGKVSQS